MIVEKTLEFRGIPLPHLMEYFTELQGESTSQDFPFVYKGFDWRATILREEEVRITSTFLVNAVFVRFEAESKEAIDRIIAKYRMKTFRIGG